MSYNYGFPRYVSVAEKKANALKAIKKLKKKNPDIRPIEIGGRKLAKSWWGIAWNNNLESYADYANRIGRGRSYVRHSAVLDLKIDQGKVEALVQGSFSEPYEVNVFIKPLKKVLWKKITRSCQGKIDSLQELAEGNFPKELETLFTKQGSGLFPTPDEITLNCDCPDWANMCKHVAAVLYGIGARLDENPSLFFTLRNVNIDELISKAITEKSQELIKKSRRRSKRVLDEGDISDIFNVEMD